MIYLDCVTILLVFLVSSAEAMKFGTCNSDECHLGRVLNVCSNKRSVRHECSKDANFVRKYMFPEKVLKMHNDFRNEIAKGSFHGFAVAGRMATMEWDDNLENIAQFSLTECILQKKKCFSSNKYPKPGINMAYNKFKCPQSTSPVIDAQLFMWINEYRHANMKSLRTGKSINGREIGHFLQLVKDSADRIGCSFLQMVKDGWYYQFMSCAYSVRFEKSEMAYKTGKTPGHKCKTGTNPQYTNLCSTNETYGKANGEKRVATKKLVPTETTTTNRKKTKTKKVVIKKDTSESTDTTDSKSEGHSDNKYMENVLEWLKQVDPNKGMKLDVEQTNIKRKQKDSLVLNIVNHKGR